MDRAPAQAGREQDLGCESHMETGGCPLKRALPLLAQCQMCSCRKMRKAFMWPVRPGLVITPTTTASTSLYRGGPWTWRSDMEKLRSAPIQSEPFSLKQGEDKTTASGVAVSCREDRGEEPWGWRESCPAVSVTSPGSPSPSGCGCKGEKLCPHTQWESLSALRSPCDILVHEDSWSSSYLGKCSIGLTAYVLIYTFPLSVHEWCVQARFYACVF